MAYFKETQKLNQVWLWVLLMAVTTAVVSLLSYLLYMQLYQDEPIGRRSLSDNQLILLCTTVLVIMTIIDWTILSGKLEVEVTSTAVRYRFFPFIPGWKILKRKDIANYEVRKFNLLKDFGGRGYKSKPGSGKAISVKGNKGLQLTLKNGKILLLGTQKPREIKQAMDRLVKQPHYG
ncbi:hypothetical protein C900_05302 [Fulvivirga imtechensis AK7]|uniref:Bacterial Pleckstrin homology domain-containing protein n=1 Tax=Fulvivirga imtechensis AK7 TaxID=1237149 RepID=L8JJZ7_9BACT|nr:hypothetical protein [Fulvivirga imtechensis]ELR69231.1 hypothetical protein C900_05302 [Fulvivirga imtechensis AK7]